MLLLMDNMIIGPVRERILIAYYRYKVGFIEKREEKIYREANRQLLISTKSSNYAKTLDIFLLNTAKGLQKGHSIIPRNILRDLNWIVT